MCSSIANKAEDKNDNISSSVRTSKFIDGREPPDVFAIPCPHFLLCHLLHTCNSSGFLPSRPARHLAGPLDPLRLSTPLLPDFHSHPAPLATPLPTNIAPLHHKGDISCRYPCSQKADHADTLLDVTLWTRVSTY
jgi:hypothetical protein